MTCQLATVGPVFKQHSVREKWAPESRFLYFHYQHFGVLSFGTATLVVSMVMGVRFHSSWSVIQTRVWRDQRGRRSLRIGDESPRGRGGEERQTLLGVDIHLRTNHDTITTHA